MAEILDACWETLKRENHQDTNEEFISPKDLFRVNELLGQYSGNKTILSQEGLDTLHEIIRQSVQDSEYDQLHVYKEDVMEFFSVVTGKKFEDLVHGGGGGSGSGSGNGYGSGSGNGYGSGSGNGNSIYTDNGDAEMEIQYRDDIIETLEQTAEDQKILVQKLQKQCKSQEVELRRVQAEAEELRNRALEQAREIEALKKTRAGEAHRKENKELSETNDRLNAQVLELSQKFESIEKMQNEIREKKDVHKKLKEQIFELKAEHANALNEKNLELSSANLKNVILKEDLSQVQEQLAKCKQELDKGRRLSEKSLERLKKNKMLQIEALKSIRVPSAGTKGKKVAKIEFVTGPRGLDWKVSAAFVFAVFVILVQTFVIAQRRDEQELQLLRKIGLVDRVKTRIWPMLEIGESHQVLQKSRRQVDEEYRRYLEFSGQF